MKILHKNQPNELIIRTVKNEIIVKTRKEYDYELKRKVNSMRFIVSAFLFFKHNT